MTEPHTHEWKDPEMDFSRLCSRAFIEFCITGQICDCGAKRIYLGPMYGWKIISEGNLCQPEN